MTTFLIIRHGIAQDPRPGQPDAERSLTEEGWAKTRAAMRGLVARGHVPTRGFTSPYLRARETMACLQEAAGPTFPVEAWEGLVPHGSPARAETWMRGLAEEVGPLAVLALTSHQPLLGDLLYRLTGLSLEVKKASCTVVRWTGDGWRCEGHYSPSELRSGH